jgi:hypothetical protein
VDQLQQIDHAEHNYYRPCGDCGGPQWEDEHTEDCPQAVHPLDCGCGTCETSQALDEDADAWTDAWTD